MIRALFPLVAALALALAPTSAHAVVEWRDAGAAVPATADLHAVATSGATVIAVGTDRVTGEAVVHRRAAGAWQQDRPLAPPVDPALPAPPPLLGTLVDVAIGGTNAWAVGSAPVPGGGQRPLILRFDGTTWTEVPADAMPPDLGPVTALALDGDDGLVGDASGKVFALTDGAIAGTALKPAGLVPPPPSPVNALALDSAARAFGVAQRVESWAGFLEIDRNAGELKQHAAETMPGGLHPIAVATAGGLTSAVAGPGPCRSTPPGSAPDLWSRDPQLGLWRRQTPDASASQTRWCDVAMAGTTLLLAGDRSTATGRVGAIWRREGTTGTLRLEKDLGARPLFGVALGATEAFAVGAEGALWRHADWPAPPPAGDGGGGDGGDGGGDTQTGGDQGEAQPVEQSAEPAPLPAPRGEVITAQLAPSGSGPVAPPKRRTTPGTEPAQRLLVGLRATREGRRMVLRFRLKKRARVLVTAVRGTQVVGRLRSRALRPGRRRLVVPFRGSKPPTQLKIVVRPVGGRA